MGFSSSKPAVEYTLPDITNKTVIVTGANTGLGLASSKILAGQGANVIMACRSKEKGEKALEEVKKFGKAELRLLDLSDLDSVTAFSEEIKSSYSQIDYLLNNAGIMACDQATTKQGMDLQIGTNHFGHYALTMRLLPLLHKAPEARVTTVASIAADRAPATMPWDDYMFQGKGKYDSWKVYGTSKLFNIYFTNELQKKLDAAGITNVTATAAHPGWTSTDLQRHSGFALFLQNYLVPTMKPEDGCKPQVISLIGKHVQKGAYVGVSGALTGTPALDKPPASTYHEEDEAKLWAESEKLTGLKFPL